MASLFLPAGGADRLERQVLRAGVMLFTPLLKHAPVAQRQVLGTRYVQFCGNAVNPLGLALQFGEVADGRLVDDAVAFAITPLAAPLLIPESCHKAKGTENFRQRLAVGDFCLGLHAVLMKIFARPVVGKALVGQEAFRAVDANAQNLGPGTHLPVGRVVEHVAFKGSRGFEMEAGLGQTHRQFRWVVDAKFDLRLHRYHDL